MSTNPKSANFRDIDLAHEGRALARKGAIDAALAASTGVAGLAEGNAAKKAVEQSDGK